MEIFEINYLELLENTLCFENDLIVINKPIKANKYKYSKEDINAKYSFNPDCIRELLRVGVKLHNKNNRRVYDVSDISGHQLGVLGRLYKDETGKKACKFFYHKNIGYDKEKLAKNQVEKKKLYSSDFMSWLGKYCIINNCWR